ncbi:L-threonylcarbamoyladenylate synthase [Bartonella sp. HY329]|uniref:L-threonylcarbamoyladenylate synthase n=1 Tax=unclassified Bartonella TaxID=2645622 RepID=UPI0021C5C20E|nr:MULTISPECIES: L-threonylcarbamoyladenylate synthase [unclassified Bartonella]UXM94520.1 L-threonylcarbamoyladenylate synthase [Bartonella sp. HY329]UXN08844.1 L-threonylcarbamoyladenylate synthase [Bartonella sp. HY328]
MIVSASPTIINQVVAHLREGKLAALPTETVYGLAADATNGEAVAEIFATKGRPHFNPLIAHVASMDMAARYVEIDQISAKLMQEFWPGPLTLVLPLRKNNNIHPLATAGLPTLALRNPKGIFADIVQALDRPIVAPSANRSGRISPTSAIAVENDFQGGLPLIVDAGACEVGVESTIIKVDGDDVYLLRPGGLEREAIEAIIKRPLKQLDHGAAIEAPGMMKSHYAPNATMRLNVDEVIEGEALLHFGDTAIKGQAKAKAILNLSESGNLKEAAVHLFDYMQRLDLVGASSIAVAPIPLISLGEAINDRLNRAAAPKVKVI